MINKNRHSIHVRHAVNSLKLQLDKYPLKYKTSSDLLSNHTDVNRRTMETAFKDIFGYRIKEYHVKQRLAMSKNFLKEGKPIKQVAFKCFYRSHSAFCRAFRREFNITPSAWLKT